MKGVDRSHEARGITYLGVALGMSREKINAMITAADLPATDLVPEDTYKMILKNEVPIILKNPAKLFEFIKKPKPISKLKADDTEGEEEDVVSEDDDDENVDGGQVPSKFDSRLFVAAVADLDT